MHLSLSGKNFTAEDTVIQEKERLTGMHASFVAFN